MKEEGMEGKQENIRKATEVTTRITYTGNELPT